MSGFESPTVPRPTKRGMALLAIRILDAMVAAAHEHPIEMTDPARLAIGWLMHDGIANEMQAGRFVAAVTKPPRSTGPQAEYLRYTEMTQMLEAWRREIRRRDFEDS